MKTNQIKLSIVIVSIPSRHATLSRLLGQLSNQPRFDECEVVVVIDNGTQTIGRKRNKAVAACGGDYVVHIDDDDEVAENYLDRILTAIDLDAGDPPDAIIVRGRCTSPGFFPVEFDYSLDVDLNEARWVETDGVQTLWRTPGHLCAIRAWICQNVPFQTTVVRGEDLTWAASIWPFLKKVVRASSAPLYFYRLAPEKARTIEQMVRGVGQPEPIETVCATCRGTREVAFGFDHSSTQVKCPTCQRDSYDEQAVELTPHEPIFAPQYVEKSGPGSTESYSAPYRRFLLEFMHEHEIRSMFDLGCGDMEIMSRVIHESRIARDEAIFVDVIGERIVRNRAKHPELQFAHADIRTFPLDAALIHCKDVLQHWNNAEVEAFLERLISNSWRFRYALITNCCYGPTINTDIQTGGWRALDLTREPFKYGAEVFRWGDEIGGFKQTVLIKGLR